MCKSKHKWTCKITSQTVISHVQTNWHLIFELSNIPWDLVFQLGKILLCGEKVLSSSHARFYWTNMHVLVASGREWCCSSPSNRTLWHCNTESWHPKYYIMNKGKLTAPQKGGSTLASHPSLALFFSILNLSLILRLADPVSNNS